MSTLTYALSALLAVALVVGLVLLAHAAQILITRRIDTVIDRALTPDVCPRCGRSDWHAPTCSYGLRDAA